MVDADMPLDDFGALTAIEINQESNSYTMGAVTFHLAADWNEHWFYNDKDGYFYCKSVMWTNVKINSDRKLEKNE